MGTSPIRAPRRTNFELAKTGSADALGRLLEDFRVYLQVMADTELDAQLRAKVGPSDLVQETMIEARRDFAAFRGQTKAEFIAWLRQILMNNLANVRRHYLHTRRRHLSSEVPLAGDESWNAEQVLADSTETPGARVLAREEDELVDAAIGRLPGDQQEVIHLRHREGLSFVEIGERMNRSSDAARKLWVRAIDRMQQELRGETE